MCRGCGGGCRIGFGFGGRAGCWIGSMRSWLVGSLRHWVRRRCRMLYILGRLSLLLAMAHHERAIRLLADHLGFSFRHSAVKSDLSKLILKFGPEQINCSFFSCSSNSRAAPPAHAEILHRAAFGRLRATFPDSSNHFAHERIVFQAHFPRNRLLKREPDIIGTNSGRDRHKGLRILLRYLANSLKPF